jgi:hypothetical protein
VKPSPAQQAFGSGTYVSAKVIPVCSFDKQVALLGLMPNEYETSAELKAWCKQNKETFYVPTVLMTAWGFTTQWDVAEKPSKLEPDTIAFADMSTADVKAASYDPFVTQ